MRIFLIALLSLSTTFLSAAVSDATSDITDLLIPEEEFQSLEGLYVLSIISDNGLWAVKCRIKREENSLYLQTDSIESTNGWTASRATIPIYFTGGGTSILIRLPISADGMNPHFKSDNPDFYDICAGSSPPNSVHFSGYVVRSEDSELIPNLTPNMKAGAWIMTRVGELSE